MTQTSIPCNATLRANPAQRQKYARQYTHQKQEFASLTKHKCVPRLYRRTQSELSTKVGLRPTVCVANVSESSFEEEVLKEKHKIVLVDFWATWCGPCKLIDPYMKQVEEEYSDKLKVVKVEADPNPGLVEKYKVYGLPTLILFKSGSMIKGSLKEGAITKPALLKYLEKYGIVQEVAN